MLVKSISHALHTATPTLIPESSTTVPAGFPSPAQDYFDGDLNLDELLIQSRVSTYIVQASGHSMQRAGIFDGDKLVVDRAIQAQDGHIVIAIVDGELTVKRLRILPGRVVLCPENPAFADIEIPELAELQVWGVVTWVLHRTARESLASRAT